MELVYEDETLRVAEKKNLSAAVWWAAPRVAQLDKIEESITRLQSRYPQGVGWLDVVIEGTPLFSEQVRRRTIEMSKGCMNRALAIAHVITLRGVFAATSRTFITTILLVSRPIAPTKVFAGIEPAAAWMAPLIGKGEPPAWGNEEIIELFADIVSR